MAGFKRSKPLSTFEWLSGIGALIFTVVAALALFGSWQKKEVNSAIARSTAPVLVPAGPWEAEFDFTAPPGSTNLYLFRWNFEVGATDGVSGWQVGPGASFEPPRLAEAPGQAEVARVLRAASDLTCPTVDADVPLRLCTYPAEFELGGVHAFLVRPVRAQGAQTLVVEYVNRDGNRSEYDSGALEARYAASNFDQMSLRATNLDDYLVSIY